MEAPKEYSCFFLTNTPPPYRTAVPLLHTVRKYPSSIPYGSTPTAVQLWLRRPRLRVLPIYRAAVLIPESTLRVIPECVCRGSHQPNAPRQAEQPTFNPTPPPPYRTEVPVRQYPPLYRTAVPPIDTSSTLRLHIPYGSTLHTVRKYPYGSTLPLYRTEVPVRQYQWGTEMYIATQRVE